MRTAIKIFFLSVAILHLSGCFALLATGAVTGAAIAHDRRTTGTIVEDQSIELKAFKAITDIDAAKGTSHVSAISYNNNLLLIGQTPSDGVRRHIEEALQDIPKVRRIYNEIAVAAPTSMMTRSSDSWITAKIKSDMFLSNALDATRIKVITEDGVVYLMGITSSLEDQEAVEVARRAKGVKKVVKMFETIELLEEIEPIVDGSEDS